jgi:acylphosphatase
VPGRSASALFLCVQHTISIIVKGKVQGVFFRQSTREKAASLGITGTVANLADGSVHIVATGTKEQLNSLSVWAHTGPPKADVLSVDVTSEELKSFPDFRILKKG